MTDMQIVVYTPPFDSSPLVAGVATIGVLTYFFAMCAVFNHFNDLQEELRLTQERLQTSHDEHLVALEELQSAQQELQMARQHQDVLESDNEMLMSSLESAFDALKKGVNAVPQSLPVRNDPAVLASTIHGMLTNRGQTATQILLKLRKTMPYLMRADINTWLYKFKNTGTVTMVETAEAPLWYKKN